LIEGVWLLGGRTEVTGAAREKLLLAPTKSLSEDAQLFAELTSDMDWNATCRQAESKAMSIVFERSWVRGRLAKGMPNLSEDFERFVMQSAAREREFGAGDSIAGLRSRQELIESALRNPRIEIDSCGVLFVGPQR
jgi:hypothetical protein